MTTTIKSSADGTQAIIQVNGVDKVVVGSTGIESGSYKAGSIRPVDTQVGAVPSMVRLATHTSYGSTNTCIARWTTTITNQGTDITYVDSATLGATFTINVSGIYAMNLQTNATSANAIQGISVNSNQLTTGIQSITAAHRVAITQTYSGTATAGCSNTMYLDAGSIVRCHNDGGALTGNPAQFTIQRVA